MELKLPSKPQAEEDEFLKSKYIEEMLSMVAPIYDRSQVAKSLLGSQGLAIDMVKKQIEELPKQVFPEIATYGLKYWEQLFDIPPSPNLSYEGEDRENRKLSVIAKRNMHYAVSPERIRQTAFSITKTNTSIEEMDKPGYYRLVIEYLNNERIFDKNFLINTINEMKPSHIAVLFYYFRRSFFNTFIKIQTKDRMRNRITAKLDGIAKRISVRTTHVVKLRSYSWLLDGSMQLDGTKLLKDLPFDLIKGNGVVITCNHY